EDGLHQDLRALAAVVVVALEAPDDRRHRGRERVSGFGPGMAERLDTLPPVASIVGRLKRDDYNGGQSAEILVEAIF
ncbi:MAG: hypothetical protein AAGA56_10880, partial [Myxococcota bacterium]